MLGKKGWINPIDHYAGFSGILDTGQGEGLQTMKDKSIDGKKL